jgi:hypothetical protein
MFELDRLDRIPAPPGVENLGANDVLARNQRIRAKNPKNTPRWLIIGRSFAAAARRRRRSGQDILHARDTQLPLAMEHSFTYVNVFHR